MYLRFTIVCSDYYVIRYELWIKDRFPEFLFKLAKIAHNNELHYC